MKDVTIRVKKCCQSCQMSQVENTNGIMDRPIINNNKLKQILLGTIIGMFSNKNINFYKTNYSKINKRIFSMLNDRIIDQLIKLDVV